MYQDNITLCGASAYEKKFYFNQDFNALPDHVKKELQIMCVLYTEDVGGILTLEFDENGRLQFKTEALEADARYDRKVQFLAGVVFDALNANQEVSAVSLATSVFDKANVLDLLWAEQDAPLSFDDFLFQPHIPCP